MIREHVEYMGQDGKPTAGVILDKSKLPYGFGEEGKKEFIALDYFLIENDIDKKMINVASNAIIKRIDPKIYDVDAYAKCINSLLNITVRSISKGKVREVNWETVAKTFNKENDVTIMFSQEGEVIFVNEKTVEPKEETEVKQLVIEK